MKKFILIKSTKEYIFISTELSKSLKITENILKINYPNLKYKNIFYFKCKDILNIYNYNSTGISLPEGFIIYKNTQKDGIYMLPNPKGYINIVIRKKGCLIKDYFVYTLNEQDKKLLQFEYNLPLFTENYSNFIQQGLKKISLLEIIKFLPLIKINKNKIKLFFNSLTFPFLITSIILTLLAYGIKTYYQDIYSKKLQKLKNLKKQSLTLRNKINIIHSLTKKYTHILNETNKNKINIINKIAASLNNDSRISYIRLETKQIIFTIDANDSTKLLTNLNKIKEIKNLKLISSAPINKHLKRYRFEGEIY